MKRGVLGLHDKANLWQGSGGLDGEWGGQIRFVFLGNGVDKSVLFYMSFPVFTQLPFSSFQQNKLKITVLLSLAG